MDLLTKYILPNAAIIAAFVLDYRNRLRRFTVKQALFFNFIAASFCAGLHLRRDLRVAMIMFLFIFTITSLAAVRRLFCGWFCACGLGQSRRSVPVHLRPHGVDFDRSLVRTSSLPVNASSERHDRQGATMNNVRPQCRFVAALVTAFLLIPAMSASAQTTQIGPTSDRSDGDRGGSKTLVATVLGEPLYLEQFTPADAELKRKELSPADFNKWLIEYRAARLFDFVWAAVRARYIERETIGVSDEEFAALEKSVDQNLKSRPGGPDESPFPSLEDRGIANAWSRAVLIDWKVCKSLYEKYGGRVGTGSLGAWIALDGQHALLKERHKAGDIKFHDADIESAFWKYAQREHFADTYPTGEQLQQLLATPPFLRTGESRVKAGHNGAIVSHIDSYGSGTGGRTTLSSSGQMNTGFNYGDSENTDWKGSIKWRLLRKEGISDVYEIEWNFKPSNGTSTSKVEELAFDGVQPAKLIVNQQWVISIERDRIGAALGKDIYRDELKDTPPTYHQVVQLFIAPAMEEYEREKWETCEMTDDEILAGLKWMEAEAKKQGGARWEQWQAQSKQQKSEVDKRLAEIKSQLDNPATPDNERPLLKTAMRVAALESTHPHASEVWLSMHRRKFELYLFNNYGGGRIIHQQFGPEALDARRKLLLELEQAGKFQITDPELRKLAFDYWERPSHPGGFHTDHRLLLFPWTKAHQEMIQENEGTVPATIK